MAETLDSWILVMSFLPALRLGARRAVYSAYAGPATTSAFHSSAMRPTLKETDKSEFCFSFFFLFLFIVLSSRACHF